MSKKYRPEIAPDTFESVEAHAQHLGLPTTSLINLILKNWLQDPVIQVKSDLKALPKTQVPATAANPKKSDDEASDSITIKAWSPAPNAGPVFESTPETPSNEKVIGDD